MCKRIWLSTLLVCITFSIALSQTTGDYQTIGTGNWSAIGIWQIYNGTAFVAATDYPGQNGTPSLVSIRNSHNVTLDVSPAFPIGALDLGGAPAGGINTALTLAGTNSLTVAGVITIYSSTSNTRTKQINVDNGTLTCGSINMLALPSGPPPPNNRFSFVNLTGGTINVLGNITMNSATFHGVRLFGSGTLNIGGNISGGSVTTTSGSTVNYNGNNQTVFSTTYYNLELSGTGTKDLSSVFLINENLTISGTVTATAGQDIAIAGTITLGSGNTFDAGPYTHFIGGDWINNGSTFLSSGTVVFDGDAQEIGGASPTTFNNLEASNSGIKTFSQEITVTGNLSIFSPAEINFGGITTHTAGTISLDGNAAQSGSWGSSSSVATNVDDTYFDADTGLINVLYSVFYTRASGAWNSNNTWSFSVAGPPVGAGIFPGAGDLVNIWTGHTVTVTTDAACASIVYLSGGSSKAININSGITLSVSGTIDLSRAGGGNNNSLNVGAGTLNAGSIAFTSGGSGGGIRHQLSITTGTVTVTGDITTDFNSAGAHITFTGAGTGTLNAGIGILTTGISAGTLITVAGSTINYNGTTQTVKPVAYAGNLILSGSGDKTLTGVTTIGGNFTLAGTATATATTALTIGGTVTFEAGTGFTAGAFTHNVSGNWINNGGTFTQAGSTINLNLNGAQNIGGSSSTTFNNLTLSSGDTKTFGIATIMDGNLSIATGVVADLGTITTHTANSLTLGGVNQPSGTWGSTSSGAINQNDTFFAATSGIISVAAIPATTYYSRATGNWNSITTWSTVGFGSAVNTGTFPIAGDIVNIGTNAGDRTVTITADAACASITFQSGSGSNNTLTINAGITLDVSDAVTLPRASGGNTNLLNVAAGILNAGSIAFTNGGAGGGIRHQLSISTGTVTVTGDITTNIANAGAHITFTSTGTLNAAVGILTTDFAGGTLTTVAGSTVNYNGAAQLVKPVAYLGNLVLSGSGDKQLTGVTSVGGNFMLAGTATTTAEAALIIGGNVTLGTGTGFTTGAFVHNVGGNWINEGATFNPAGSTIRLNGAIQSIGGSSSTLFNNLTFAGSSVKTFDLSTDIEGNFAIAVGVIANLNSITTHTASTLTLGGVNQLSGTWGSTSSSATNQNNTFFSANTGIITIAGVRFYSRATGNWNSNNTWSFTSGGPPVGVGIFPGPGDIVVIEGGRVVTVNVNSACSSMSFPVNNGNSNTVLINPGITLDVSGTITIPRASGPGITNVNLIAVNDGTLNAGNIAFTNGGGPAGTRHRINITTGTVNVTGDILQAGSNGSASIIFSNTGLLQIGGTIWSAANGTLTTVAGSTVEYTGAAQTIQAHPYLGHLILSGSDVKTLLTGSTVIGGDLTLSGTTSTTTVTGLTVGGNLSIGDATSLDLAGFPFTVAGTTTVGGGTTGQLLISSAVGTKTFNGLVTISPGATWTNDTANSPITFAGGIANNGTFSAGTGVHTFTTNVQQLTGIFDIPNVTITGISLTNNNTLTVSTALSGTGGLTQANNALLNLGGTSGITTLNASSPGNTVNYTGAINQTIKTPVGGQYVNLSFNGTTASGIATPVAATTLFVSGNWENNGTGTTGLFTGFNPNGSTIEFNGISTVSGSTITSFHEVQLASTATLTFPAGDVHVGGNLNFAAGSIFNASNGRIVFNGVNPQSISTNGNECYTIQVAKTAGAFTITSSLPIQHLLDIQTGTTVNTNDHLILLSRGFTTDLDGAIGPIPIALGASVNGNVTVQRFMDPIGNTYRYLSSAVTGALPPSSWGSTIYRYTTGGYVAHPTSSPLALGTGYTIGLNMNTPITWSVTGPISNAGSYTWNFAQEGWYLVGNPFPSAIRWFNAPGVAWDLTNIATTIAVTDNAVAGYPNYFRYWSYNPIDNPGTWGSGPLANGMVAMQQAFWVYAGAGGGSLTVYEQAKENSLSGEFYRTASPEVNQLSVSLDNGTFADAAFLKIDPQSSHHYEFKYDLKKLWNPDMNIYLSDRNQTDMVISSVDKLEQEHLIPVGVEVKEPGTYTISFAFQQDFSYATRLYLIDTYEGKAVPISDGPYTFALAEGSIVARNRFYLSLNPVIAERKLAAVVATYPNPVQDKLFVRLPADQQVTLKLIDVQGKEWVSSEIKGSHEIDMRDYPKGMYVLRIFTKDEVVIQKILR